MHGRRDRAGSGADRRALRVAGRGLQLLTYDEAQRPVLLDSVARHPKFDLNTLLAHRATADVALIRLAAPLPAEFASAGLAEPGRPIAVGDPFVVAGYGVAVRGDGKTGGTVRTAKLVATGQPGSLQLRLVDPVAKGERAGLGACTGDSGAPVFTTAGEKPAVVGVVSWSTGPKLSAGCGGLTGVTPLARYRDWVLDAARRMGSPVGP